MEEDLKDDEEEKAANSCSAWLLGSPEWAQARECRERQRAEHRTGLEEKVLREVVRRREENSHA